MDAYLHFYTIRQSNGIYTFPLVSLPQETSTEKTAQNELKVNVLILFENLSFRKVLGGKADLCTVTG